MGNSITRAKHSYHFISICYDKETFTSCLFCAAYCTSMCSMCSMCKMCTYAQASGCEQDRHPFPAPLTGDGEVATSPLNVQWRASCAKKSKPHWIKSVPCFRLTVAMWNWWDITDNGIVQVRLQGACKGCPMSQITLKNGVERGNPQGSPGSQSRGSRIATGL